MKKYISTPLVAIALITTFLLGSCAKNDGRIGELLIPDPNSEEYNTPKVYVGIGPRGYDNKVEFKILKLLFSDSISMPSNLAEGYEIFPKLANAYDKDVTVRLVTNNDAVQSILEQEGKEDYNLIPSTRYTIATSEVTIKAGQYISEQPFKVKINTENYQTGKFILPLTIEVVNDDNVKIVSNLKNVNIFCTMNESWQGFVNVADVKPEGITALDHSEWLINDVKASNKGHLFDNSLGNYEGVNSGILNITNINDEVSYIKVGPLIYYGYLYSFINPINIQITTENDEVRDLGNYEMDLTDKEKIQNNGGIYLKLNEPTKVKSVRLEKVSGYGKIFYISELGLYK